MNDYSETLNKQHVFIIGCKGIPSAYGGFETFVDNLVSYQQNENIQYHVACATEDQKSSFYYNKARCFNIKWKKLGSAKAIFYDIDAFREVLKYIQENKIENPIVYILACRIGPFIKYFKKRLKKVNGKIFVNPDGHEFLRGKWSYPVKCYWKYSEKLMIKHSDLIICDSKNIEKYILKDYQKFNPKTTFIAYGTDTAISETEEKKEQLANWYKEKNILGDYYLIVGRFVPENNYETMIKEFMKTKTNKDLVIITNVESKFFNKLENNLNMTADHRVKFVGTVYDKELLKGIRKNAFAYVHGHEVGGTNPSLLESLAFTDVNLLYDVAFNREVAENNVYYWNKQDNHLADLIKKIDILEAEASIELGRRMKQKINKDYSWKFIVNEYETIFTK